VPTVGDEPGYAWESAPNVCSCVDQPGYDFCKGPDPTTSVCTSPLAIGEIGCNVHRKLPRKQGLDDARRRDPEGCKTIWDVPAGRPICGLNDPHRHCAQAPAAMCLGQEKEWAGQCVAMKAVGQACEAGPVDDFAAKLEYHTQCKSGYCSPDGTCTVAKAIGADCAADYECGFDFETNHMTGTAIAVERDPRSGIFVDRPGDRPTAGNLACNAGKCEAACAIIDNVQRDGAANGVTPSHPACAGGYCANPQSQLSRRTEGYNSPKYGILSDNLGFCEALVGVGEPCGATGPYCANSINYRLLALEPDTPWLGCIQQADGAGRCTAIKRTGEQCTGAARETVDGEATWNSVPAPADLPTFTSGLQCSQLKGLSENQMFKCQDERIHTKYLPVGTYQHQCPAGYCTADGTCTAVDKCSMNWECGTLQNCVGASAQGRRRLQADGPCPAEMAACIGDATCMALILAPESDDKVANIMGNEFGGAYMDCAMTTDNAVLPSDNAAGTSDNAVLPSDNAAGTSDNAAAGTCMNRCDMTSHVYLGAVLPCSEGQFCELDSCEPKRPFGEKCPRDEACVSGAFCNSGVCSQALELGSECVRSGQCAGNEPAKAATAEHVICTKKAFSYFMTDMTDPQEELGRDGYSSEDGDGTGTCAGTCEHSWYCRYLEYQETTLGKLVAGALLLMVLMSLGTCMAAICCHPHMSHGKAVGTYNFGGKKDKWQFEPPPSNPCFGPHIPQGADWEASGAEPDLLPLLTDLKGAKIDTSCGKPVTKKVRKALGATWLPAVNEALHPHGYEAHLAVKQFLTLVICVKHHLPAAKP